MLEAPNWRDNVQQLDGLIEVTKFFLSHPWPDCYARQIPVSVDTKFVERHQSVLCEWLDELLPASAIQTDETKFPLRFGLRDRQPHITFRVLDPELQAELRLPFDEFSVPLRYLATLPVRNATVIIVENQLNLLTLPLVRRGIALRGEGDAVTRLAKLNWLNDNRAVYWGDIDIEGFEILSSFRRFIPDIRSLLMDRNTLGEHSQFIVQGNEVAQFLGSTSVRHCWTGNMEIAR
jgi:hypothetical protein